MIKQLILFALLSMHSCCMVLADEILTVLPNPITNPSECGRQSPSHICDPYRYISKENAEQLDSLIAKLNHGTATKESRGVEYAIAVTNRMEGVTGSLQDEAKRNAVQLHNSWGVGDRNTNNGIVLFISIEDRQLYFSTGSGVEQEFSPLAIDYVINEMKPFMRKEEYGEALKHSVIEIEQYITKQKVAKAKEASMWPIALFGTVVAGAIVAAAVNGRNYGRCRAALSELDKDRARAKANNFEIPSCAICLEDFDTIDSNTPMNDTLPFGMIRDLNSNAVLLRCGHKFCQPCLTNWLEKHVECPVCRDAGVSKSDVESTRVTRRTSHVHSEEATQSFSNEELYNQHYGLHLHRLHRMYPQYISRTMYEDCRACPPNRLVSVRSFANHSSPQGVSQAVSSSSFGGGSSSGGGGGSW